MRAPTPSAPRARTAFTPCEGALPVSACPVGEGEADGVGEGELAAGEVGVVDALVSVGELAVGEPVG